MHIKFFLFIKSSDEAVFNFAIKMYMKISATDEAGL